MQGRSFLLLPVLCWILSPVFLSSVTASGLEAAKTSRVATESSIAKEGVSSLALLCDYLPSTNETVYHVTWTKVQDNDDAIVIFEKHLVGNSGSNYSFFGSWCERRAQHSEMTLADVSLWGADVSRDDAGKYRCEVISDLGVIYDDTAVTVLYGPGNSIHISSQNGSFRVTEGETITLRCTADCLPSCQFRWTCAGCMTTREATLTVTNIQSDQSGVYTCLAYNTVSRGRSDVTVDVLYPAYIKELRFAGGTRILQVPEGRSVSISCQSRGNPPPSNVTWTVSGQSKHNKTFAMKYGHDVSSVFMLPSASCHDNDKYTCTATNGLRADVQSVFLNVLCQPIPDTECNYGNTSRIVSFSGTTNLTSCIFARPRPSVKWYRVISDVDSVLIEGQNITYDEVRARLKTWISLSVVGVESYGVYRVVIANEIGDSAENFTIESKESPQAPQNFTVYNVTTTSFCLTWTAGFDGGSQQTFLLTYISRSSTVKTKNYQAFIPAVKSDDVTTYCAGNLAPDISYEVTLRAENVYGSREESVVKLNVTTLPGLTRTSTLGLLSLPLVKVVTPVGVVVLLLLLVALFCFVWRRRHSSVSRKQENSAKRQSTLLCFSNENVRLSYLETSRQASYIDATSRVASRDVTSASNDVSTNTNRGGSRLEAGTPLGVDALSRRPSSTPSSNIYLDILGEPATYANQDEGASTCVNADTYEIPDSLQCADDMSQRRPTGLFEHYIDMNGTVKNTDEEITENNDVISLDSSDYDDAWCALSKFPLNNMNLGEVSLHGETSSRDIASRSAGGVSKLTGACTIPTITISNERGERMNFVQETCDDACRSGSELDDDVNVYDVIKDSDVED